MKIFSLLFLFVSFNQFISATTYTVCASGCDYTTINAALTAASSNDIIEIQDAIHTEEDIEIEKNITIQGQGQTSTIIQANAVQANAIDGVFKISTVGLTVIFQDLTIQNGNALSSQGSNLDLGGAVYIKCNASTNIAFNRVSMINNKAVGDKGGAVYITDDGTGEGTVSFTDCLITNNEASGSSGDGGGIANRGADNFAMINCTVSNNIAGDDGGGIYVFEEGSTNEFINCTIFNNSAGASSSDEARGGAVYVAGDNTFFNIYNCTIVDNSVSTVATKQGGGIYQTSSSTLDLVNTIVANNSGATDGNDIYTTNGSSNLTQTTSLVESCDEGSGSCPAFSYFGDPNLAVANTCGVHTYFPVASKSFISDNGTAPFGDIPTDDICGITRSGSTYDIGSYDDLITTTGLIETIGNIEDYINNSIHVMPLSDLDDYAEPTGGELTIWTDILDDLLLDNPNNAQTDALLLDYEIILFTDNSVNPNKQFYILQKQTTGTNFWGTYVFNPSPTRELIIQSPHAIFDSNTGNQSAYCFKNTDARLLMLTGTHRCNSTDSTSCSGTTTTCTGNSEAFRLSDLAHNTNNCFQITSNKLHDDISNTIFVQLHGFSQDTGDPDVIISNGTTITPSGTDYATCFKTALEAEDSTLTFKVAHTDSWTYLIGSTNTQGRYINASANPCTVAATIPTGRFIHVEQEKTKLRDDATGWAKVNSALLSLSSCIVLPVEMTYFTAKTQENQTNLLEWQTASEVNNEGFEIQRSIDGKYWETLDFIPGSGTTADVQSYYYTDKTPLFTINFYRLKQIDFDGTFEYSKIVIVKTEAFENEVSIFPNPVINQLTIKNGIGNIIIYNSIGQPVMQLVVNSEQLDLNISDLLSGIYTIQIQHQNGQITTKQFIK